MRSETRSAVAPWPLGLHGRLTSLSWKRSVVNFASFAMVLLLTESGIDYVVFFRNSVLIKCLIILV